MKNTQIINAGFRPHTPHQTSEMSEISQNLLEALEAQRDIIEGINHINELVNNAIITIDYEHLPAELIALYEMNNFGIACAAPIIRVLTDLTLVPFEMSANHTEAAYLSLNEELPANIHTY